MGQVYEVTAIDTGKEPFKDRNGNVWVSAAFLGVSEPVKWVVKDPSKFKVGDKVYGDITDETSSTGKPYLRFRRKQQPDPIYEQPKQEKSDGYWEDRNNSIKAQFAIKTAVELLKNPEADIAEDIIEHWARIFYKMVDRIPTEPIKQPDPIGLDEVDL